eukprot:CAMPEP_0169281992 /NCGR_PEP_ID=MMETSP1016-20121227/56615_1 /TAXON_ID=342587 /ORGANISM="Karlodinium micrum, Strain CCMP2283" /LENGTH=271 /DNA_ID=CAMNT_0009370779 /DNA_START=189 /DNA_END=1004 /DNA_ORIENTATION=-
MVGFGFMDNTVMLHAGNAIDMSLGATFGLSTLSAAACGQICSDMAGVCFGGIIERGAEKFGLPSADLSAEQQNSPLVGHVGLIGRLVGVFTGCSLGLLNLFFIDTHQSQEIKLANASGDAGFSIMVDNEEKHGLTAVRLEGPGHVQGVIAAVTSALAAYGCRIIEINGHRDEERLCITFSLTKDGARLEDDELQALIRSIMAACNHPEQMAVLRHERDALRKRITELELENRRLYEKLEEFLVKIKFSNGDTFPKDKQPDVGQLTQDYQER